MDLREFVDFLDKEKRLIRIKKPVSLNYEMAAIMNKLDGCPLLFEHVKGQRQFRVAANLCSHRDYVAAGLGVKKENMIKTLANAIKNPKEPNVVKNTEYKQLPVDLKNLPILTHYQKDGGPYMTSSVVVINDPELGLNASCHRMQVLSKNEVVARILPRHLEEYIKRGNVEFVICIGNPVPVMVASAISTDLGKSELSIANAIKPTELVDIEGFWAPKAEFILVGEITTRKVNEGPFVDLTGTYDLVRKERVIKIKKIYSKHPSPVYHALLPGGLEHKILMGMPREPIIFQEVNKVCNCRNALLTPGGCSWLHGVVQIKKRRADDGKRAIKAAFKGHSSMKHLVVVDDDVDIYNPNEIEWALATRFQGKKDMIMKEEPGSSLDPSSHPKTKMTTKIGLDATIPSGTERTNFEKAEPPEIDVKKYVE